MSKSHGNGQYIIIDIETNKYHENNIEKTEIIQLSAVRVKSERFGSQLTIKKDVFDTYIKNQHPINNEVAHLTQITEQTLNQAPKFEEAYKSFIKWIDKVKNSNKFIVTWGNRDKIYLDKECSKYTIPHLQEDFLDLQSFIQLKKGMKIPPSLESQVKKYLGQFEGQKHNSLNDALNTAYLLIEVMKESAF